MKPTTVLFDLDGTLLDTLEDITDGCNEALARFGYPQKSVEQIRLAVGNGFKKLVERIIPQGTLNPQFPAVYEAAHAAYARHARNKTRPYDGILDALGALKADGIRLGIISNKPDHEVKELAACFFDGLVPLQAAVGEKESEGIRRKPYPDSVLAVMRLYGATTQDTLYVGDSDVDIQTARNAGIPCLSVSWGFRKRAFLEQNGAATIIDTPDRIVQFVRDAT